MREREWVKVIMNMLNDEFAKQKKPKFCADVEVKLPYEIMIKKFEKVEEKGKFKKCWKPMYGEKKNNENNFATDLVIYEEKEGYIIPHVVIEAKLKEFTTHDVITYGKKAVMHRALMPALRYGIMIGASKGETLTWRLFEHGKDFDFMFSFKTYEPDEKERKDFIELVKAEIKNSKKLENMFDLKGEWAGIYCLQKSLKIKPAKKLRVPRASNATHLSK